VLSAFIEILGQFQNDRITLMEARGKVKELFKGQADLLLEFDEFLPIYPSSQQIWYNVADENPKRLPATRHTGCVTHPNASEKVCTIPHGDQSPSKVRSVSKTGVSLLASDPASALTVEKRKGQERLSETGCIRVESSGVATKRRLISISKLQNAVKRCVDGQGKDSWLEPPQSNRKFQRPVQLALASCGDGERNYKRYFIGHRWKRSYFDDSLYAGS
jgi:hypothetical protein